VHKASSRSALHTTTHPLYTRSTKRISTSISEATMPPSPTCGRSCPKTAAFQASANLVQGAGGSLVSVVV
jgi:hypothetical protein